MNKYVVQYMTTNRRGFIEDREVTVFALSAHSAVFSVKDMDPKSVGHTAHILED